MFVCSNSESLVARSAKHWTVLQCAATRSHSNFIVMDFELLRSPLPDRISKHDAKSVCRFELPLCLSRHGWVRRGKSLGMDRGGVRVK